MKNAAMTEDVKAKFEAYPEYVRPQMLELRGLILGLAAAEKISPLKETLMWGEPSYLAPNGSTIRFDWKAKSPDEFAIYFICSTRLMETFKEIYGGEFTFEGNRAIRFSLGENISSGALKHCLLLAMRYHELKHLPLLGA
tara:strand:+ start:891 stop:1310 length:420 start_codon:yes stop_codon:yes gene_type:complete